MKNYLLLALILTGVFLTKSCCLGPAAVEKTIDYGSINDSIKEYLPYIDSTTISFLDTNNLKVDLKISRYLKPKMMYPSKCKFCCKGTIYTYKWQSDFIYFKSKNDSIYSNIIEISIENREKNRIEFYGQNAYYLFEFDSLNKYKPLKNIVINTKLYKDVFKLNSRYSSDTNEYLLFNKANGILKINYKNGKSISLL